MATNPDIRDQAYQFFVEEAPELLQIIEDGLLMLRQGKDTAEIHQIMRAAHSLKGGAASVGLEAIKAIAHRLETVFKALYSDELTIDNDLESQLLQAFDCLRLPLTTQLTQGTFDTEQALTQAELVFQQLESQLATAIAETENFLPSASDLGLDIATSIFETDVQQGIDHLMQVLATPTAYEIGGELRAQAEIFIGFAELLDLTGFAAIAEATLQALDRYPDRAIEITQLAVADFREGRAAVLSDKSSPGGAPSPALLDLATASSMTAHETFDTSSVTGAAAAALEASISETAALEALSGDIETLWPDISSLSPTTVEPDTAHPTNSRPPNRGGTLEALFAPLTTPDSPPSQDRIAGDEAFPKPAAILPQKTVQAVPPTVAVTLADTVAPLAQDLTVRVDTQRLARLDNQLGELTINRNALSLQTNQMRLGLKELMNRFERVRSTVEQLQTVSDQILIAPERQKQPILTGAGTAAPIMAGETTETARLPGFDSLEMDTYTALYSYTQTLLEEMLQLEEAAADITLFNLQSDQLLGQHRKMLAQMQDDLMYARMVPLSQVLNRFPRALRELANTYNKPAELTLEGADLLVDKAVLEKLYDPLLHLLRNGFDHGLEAPEERLRQGKPETGQMTIRAYYRGRQVVIDVQDDGRGLEIECIRQRVIERGLMPPAEAQTASADQLSHYIFEPGFSTAEQVSELSGRGVGLDIVREQLRLLKGTLAVQSIAGAGTQFTLALPMTLSIVNLLICFMGSTPIAFRSDSISEIVVPHTCQLTHVDGLWHLDWQQQSVPIYRLSDLLLYQCLLPERSLSQVLAAVPHPSDWAAPVLILTRDERAFAIQVDRLVTEQESVIKPFGPVLTPPPYAYGCTVLGDGSLIPVIDGHAFLDDLLRRSGAERPTADAVEAVAAIAQQNREDNRPPQTTLQQATTVMVVDDAVTSRRTLALSLERAGYRVLQARDGQEALEQLAQNSSVQLIICDIEMPNMNGFEFLTERRQTPAIADIPTMMLTSRSNNKHRWLALQLGATDYFTKPYLEQEFMAAIAQQLQAAPTPPAS
jgi:chemotaxis family two-component system sensor histidine kinase/response regulator PixL